MKNVFVCNGNPDCACKKCVPEPSMAKVQQQGIKAGRRARKHGQRLITEKGVFNSHVYERGYILGWREENLRILVEKS